MTAARSATRCRAARRRAVRAGRTPGGPPASSGRGGRSSSCRHRRVAVVAAVAVIAVAVAVIAAVGVAVHELAVPVEQRAPGARHGPALLAGTRFAPLLDQGADEGP